MTVDEWLDSQVVEAPHLFAQNVGGITVNPTSASRVALPDIQ